MQQPYTDQQLINTVVRYKIIEARNALYQQAAAFVADQQFHFKSFYHPFSCDFARILNHPLQGINVLMRRETQYKTSDFDFSQTYVPTSRVAVAQIPAYYPQEEVDLR
jgi:hypothetical protein